MISIWGWFHPEKYLCLYNELENNLPKISKKSPGGQWLKYTRMLTQVIIDNEMIGFYETSTFNETDPS